MSMNEISKNIEQNSLNKEELRQNIEQKEELEKKENFSDQVEQIKTLYKTAAETFLSEYPELKSQVLNFFVERPGLNTELTYLLEHKTEDERNEYMGWLESVTSDSREFQSRIEMIFERMNTQEKYRELNLSNKIATQEEYEMGVFSELLEEQVRDAMLEANKKGYKTFQSGFSEKNPKDQFMDVYNKNIEIPEELITELEKKGIQISVENFKDRTTVTLHPEDKTFTISEWKDIWNYFVANLPQANEVLVDDFEEPRLHKDFRRKQDILKTIDSL